MISLRSVLLLSSISFATSAVAQSNSINDSVSTVLAKNPQIVGMVQEFKSREAQVEEAESGYFPKLSLRAGIGKEKLETPLRDTELTYTQASLTLTQMLFDGFSVSNEVDRQSFRTEAAKYEAIAAAENQSFRAIEVYLEVMKTHELQLLAQETLKNHLSIQDKMIERQESGIGTDADLAQISARVALADSTLIAAKANHRDAVTNFRRVVGAMPIVGLMQRPDDVTDLDARPLSDLTETALRQHPTLKAATADVSSAQAQQSASRSENWPRLYLEARRDANDNVNGIEGREDDTVISLNFEYDLYDGGARSSASRSTAYQVERAKSIRDNTHQEVIEAIRLAYSGNDALTRSLSTQERYVDFALKTQLAYNDQYKLGARTLLDVLNAENEHVNARRSLISISYDKQLSQFRMLNASGQLLETLAIDVNSILQD